MGSVDFYITASGPTLEAAFKQAREDAAGEHGHGATPERSPRNTRSRSSIRSRSPKTTP